MNCNYCRASNEEDSHRCNRCGRRLGEAPRAHAAAAGVGAPDAFPASTAATARAWIEHRESVPEPSRPQLVARVVTPPELAPSGTSSGVEPERGFQPSLFGPLEVNRRPAGARREGNAAQRPRLRPKYEQPQFDFPAPEALSGSSERSIYCSSSVAPATHRAAAAIFDTAIVLGAIGLFVATLHFSGYQVSFTAATWPVYAAAAVSILFLYRVLFCIANGDTPGMQWTGLRLLNFDGHQPTRDQRLQRLLGGCVSLIASGLGLFWALVDEERLTWHDHISKTFPTARVD